MKWAIHSPHAMTLDDYMASEFIAHSELHENFLSNVMKNILAAGKEAGYIDYDVSRLLLGRIAIDYDIDHPKPSAAFSDHTSYDVDRIGIFIKRGKGGVSIALCF